MAQGEGMKIDMRELAERYVHEHPPDEERFEVPEDDLPWFIEQLQLFGERLLKEATACATCGHACRPCSRPYCSPVCADAAVAGAARAPS